MTRPFEVSTMLVMIVKSDDYHARPNARRYFSQLARTRLPEPYPGAEMQVTDCTEDHGVVLFQFRPARRFL